MNARQEIAAPTHIRVRSIGAVCLAVLIAPSLALAQTGAERIPALVNPGQEVSITDDRGQAFHVRIDAVTLDGLDLLVDGKKASVPYVHIVNIDRPRDSLVNGTLIGLGVGAGFGVALVADYRSGCHPAFLGGISCPGQSAAADAWGAAFFGAFGAAIGLASDALNRSGRQIYRRGSGVHATVTPTLGPGVRGAVASVRW